MSTASYRWTKQPLMGTSPSYTSAILSSHYTIYIRKQTKIKRVLGALSRQMCECECACVFENVVLPIFNTRNTPQNHTHETLYTHITSHAGLSFLTDGQAKYIHNPGCKLWEIVKPHKQINREK